MNENENNLRRQTVAEAVIGVIFIFLLLVFLLYKFGSNKENVTNTDIENQPVSQEELVQSLDDTGGQNEIYFKYIKKIYDAQQTSGENADVDGIVLDYQKELEGKVQLPEQNVVIQKVSPTYNKTKYNNEYEIAFSNLKKAGGTSESQIFESQIVDKDTLLPLSDYDKETVLRIATEYEKFANIISSLETPKVYEKRGVGTTKDALNVAYILRQMVNTEDKQIYTLWINQYSIVMFDIIANRYAQ